MMRLAMITTSLFFFLNIALAAPTDHFVTTWKTDNPGTSNATSITVPMVGGPYDVDWDNDGTFDEFGITDSVTHDFGVTGTYVIRIRGTYDSIRFDFGGDVAKFLSIDQWGTQSWTSMERAFRGATNLEIPATDTPDFSIVTTMSYMFANAYSANPDTSGWNTSAVTNMDAMFYEATLANPATSGWDTAAVSSMDSMFVNATSANPDTSGWNTAAVTNMSSMFYGATSANPDTSGWDTAKVLYMNWMFRSASSANPDTSGWNTSKVTSMSRMFDGATVANPDTSGWDTAAVTSMYRMFDNAASANPNTSGWNTAAATDMSFMFWGAISAHPDTSGWDTAAVTSMRGMFTYASSANPDTSGWNTAAVTSMRLMFYNATLANPDTSGWDVTNLSDAYDMFAGVALSTANYDSLLVGWGAQSLRTHVTFSAGNSTYCSEAATAARAQMIASFSWTITDEGRKCPPANPSLAPDLTPSSDTGVSDSDDVTSNNTPEFYVECSAIGNTISLYTDIPASKTAVGNHICSMVGTEIAGVAAPLLESIQNISYTDKSGVLESGPSPSLLITVTGAPPLPSADFVTTWKTDNPGVSSDTSILIPMVGGPYHVDWDNDGTFDEFGVTDSVTHDFGLAGIYTIRVRGGYDSIAFNDVGDKEKILSLEQWGTGTWTSMGGAFWGARFLSIPATDIPDFSAVTIMIFMFQGATLANPDTSGWDTAAVTNMAGMFSSAITANPDTSGWDTAAVTYMSRMFDGATSANPDTSGWDTSAVISMWKMFDGATSFDRDIGSWDITALTDALDMFTGVTLSIANYESLLVGWNAQALQTGVVFSGGDSTYCSDAATTARANMIALDSWTITDGGKACPPTGPVSAPDLTPESDTGVSNSDNFTTYNTPDFFVECSIAANTVTVYTDFPVANTAIGTHLCFTDGTEIATATSTLHAGIHNITYTYTNDDGESEHSRSLAMTIDTIFANGFK